MKNNWKKYEKIWFTAFLLTLIVCALYRIAITYMVENWVVQNGGDLIAPAYLAHFADLTEKRFAGNVEEIQENSIVATKEDLWNTYYQVVNDKVEPGGFLMGESGFVFYKSGGVSVYDLATVLWIADKDGNIVLRGDYTVFWQEKKRVLVDMADCFSEEDLQKLTQIKSESMDRPPYHDHTIEMTKYVVRDGICYPLLIVVTKEDGEVFRFEGTPNFDVTGYELVTDASYEWWDETQDIADPNYQEIKEYTKTILTGHTAGEKYDAVKIVSSRRKIGNKYLKTTQYILNDGEYLLCKGELSDYSHFLELVVWLGWLDITLVAVVIAAMFTLFKRRKLQKIEYERAITNALAHDYKSSLMIQRGYAENLLYGVSEDKKTMYEQKIMDEIDKMDLRTERLLSMFRANAGGQPVMEEEIDVEALCRELVRNYEELSRKRGLTWKFERTADGAGSRTDNGNAGKDDGVSLILYGDKVLLSMALDNLINNACKYSLEDSEILLRFTKDSLTIENQWQPVEKFLKKPALFWEPYVTDDDARTSRNSGIGLSAAKQILERMHLKLSVKADREEIMFTVKKGSKGQKGKGPN
ncbi:MAG: HAMP domain-containing histidine kinase [Lachnospiraceae bacterium]|nr:HAMP domain-containing histidine kinase [Lachnospiraceae bacterium]